VFRAVDAFLDVESTAVIEAITIPGEIKTSLSAALGCTSLYDETALGVVVRISRRTAC